MPEIAVEASIGRGQRALKLGDGIFDMSADNPFYTPDGNAERGG